MIAENFKEIMERFPEESKKPIKNNKFAKKMRKEFTDNLNQVTLDLTGGNNLYKAKISPGDQQWVKNPWANVKNYKVAKTFTKGLYLSYLFQIQNGKIYLSLNQGKNYPLKTRERIAKELINKINFEIPKEFTTKENRIQTDSIMSKFYRIEDLNDKEILKDLKDMIDIYEKLIPKYFDVLYELNLNKKINTSVENILDIKNKNIWRISAGERKISEDVWKIFKEEGYVGIGFLPKENYTDYKTEEDLKNALIKKNPNNTSKTQAHKMIWKFTHDIKLGDMVIVNIGRDKAVGIGLITSDYIPASENTNPNPYERNHIRKVKWLIKEDIFIKKDSFARRTITKLNNTLWNDIVACYAKNNKKFQVKTLNYLYNLFKEEYFNTDEGKKRYKEYDHEREIMNADYEYIKRRKNNGDSITEYIWTKLISPEYSMFAVYNNSKESFKNNYDYSDEELEKIALLFFYTVDNIITKDSDLTFQKNVLYDFINNSYTKEIPTKILTPTLYYLDEDFCIINPKILDSVRFLSSFTNSNCRINNELLSYVDNNRKLQEFLVDLSKIVPELEDYKKFYEFCHWLYTPNLGNYIKENNNPIPLIDFEDTEIDMSEDGEDSSKLNLNPELIETNLKIPHNILYRISGALNAGKHIILDGAPGTGKTELTIDISETAVNENFIDDCIITTATSDWTTFDTIGGLMPDENGKLYFQEGKFLEAIRENKWLIIDEINRSDIDKAFGQLFTVLSGQSVDLPYKHKNGEPIKIVIDKKSNKSYFDETTASYKIGNNWRILSTMNVFDKDSLFDLSYAFMRRFTFINVNLPNQDTFEELIDEWGADEIDNKYLDYLKYLLRINEYRELGPAIFKDMIKYIKSRTELDNTIRTNTDEKYDIMEEAILSYIIPQFEGLTQNKLKEIRRLLENNNLLTDEIKYKLDEFAGFELDS